MAMHHEMEKLRQENDYLKQLLVKMMNRENSDVTRKIVSKQSSLQEKVSLLRDLFRGRQDVYALRWDSKKGTNGYTPACVLEWQKPICQKPLIKCSQCQHRQLLPLTDQVLIDQLQGRKNIGIYPLLQDGTCTFLAVDFDGNQWKHDVHLFLQTCKQLNVAAYIERSRSGNGAHIWIFFKMSLSAKTARELGMYLLTKTKEQNGGFQMVSFDRLFPNQDVLPKGGFGNLIALPLQKEPGQLGNSLFVDEDFRPYPDQWLVLSTVRKMTAQQIQVILRGTDQIKEHNALLMPKKISVEIKNGIHIPKEGLPLDLLEEIEEIASFNNPDYYKAKAKRMSTYGVPRLIRCANDRADALVLPRGCLAELQVLLENKSIEMEILDQAYSGENIDIDFHGTLTMQQGEVVHKLIEKDNGTLAATTGFGKTVVAAAVMAERKVNTLVIVHRTQLMKQWVEKLASFLNLSPKEIGQIGGGKNHITGKVDVATIQSLNYGGQLKSFITQYGQVIVDECHVISAVTFERVLKQIRTKHVLGLTATPKRKDGLDPIITMQCGPIRSTIDAKSQAKVRPFVHRLIKRETNFTTSQSEFHAIYKAIGQDVKRNEQIFNDVLQTLEEGRSPIILTERLEHLELLKQMFHGFAKNIIVLAGNITKKEREKELERLALIPSNEERLLIATGKYIGEGFDDARLDTLFLSMPISWKGTLQQYVGRLHRDHDQKLEVRVYDYVDVKVPVLKAMYDKRASGYKLMGYVMKNQKGTGSEQMKLF